MIEQTFADCNRKQVGKSTLDVPHRLPLCVHRAAAAVSKIKANIVRLSESPRVHWEMRVVGR